MFTKPDPSVRYARIPVAALKLAGKSVVIVGGTDGLGRAIAKAAAARGAKVTVAGRTFRDAGVAGIDFVRADLSTVREASALGTALAGRGGAIDVLIFTTGIIPGATKAVSAEGVELDMAVSALSRAVVLKHVAPTMRAGSRIFIMGFPGAGQKGDPSDLNSDRRYEGVLGWTHMQTVAVNEALVHHWAAALKGAGVGVFGLNPGLIRTNIRAGAMKGCFAAVIEGCIACCFVSPDTYAGTVLQVVAAPELAAHTGAMFSQDGAAALPTPEMKNAAHVAAMISAVDALQARAEGAGCGAGKA
jgi:NAD(P)-dependent dehydrogenase (short-subunit alcohol dehydrogenase family)